MARGEPPLWILAFADRLRAVCIKRVDLPFKWALIAGIYSGVVRARPSVNSTLSGATLNRSDRTLYHVKVLRADTILDTILKRWIIGASIVA